MALPSLFWIFSLLLTCHAQNGQLRGQNLTVSFGPDDGAECPNAEDPASLTFHTGSIPLGDICYNLDEVFSPLNTLNASGYHDYPGILWSASNAPIQYFLVNPSAYSTSTNYSKIRYSQIACHCCLL
ncbi:unnamed protein product [Cercospora beticola]|nr:unnamed protein product [Cercospora beticola]